MYLDPDQFQPALSAGHPPSGAAKHRVSPLALAQAMGVTKPSVTSILTSLMKQGVIVRRRYGKIYITDRGVLYARYYDELVEKILQHFPLAGEGFTPEECYSAAVAMAVSLPQGRLTRSAKRCTTTRTSKPTGLHVGAAHVRPSAFP